MTAKANAISTRQALGVLLWQSTCRLMGGFEPLSDAKANAIAHFEAIEQLLKEFAAAKTLEEEELVDEKLHEIPLSIQVRSGWHDPGDSAPSSVEYEILLTFGGPGCRIYGTLESGEPKSAELQYQDWGTPWTTVFPDLSKVVSFDTVSERIAHWNDTLLQFASRFYFGES